MDFNGEQKEFRQSAMLLEKTKEENPEVFDIIENFERCKKLLGNKAKQIAKIEERSFEQTRQGVYIRIDKKKGDKFNLVGVRSETLQILNSRNILKVSSKDYHQYLETQNISKELDSEIRIPGFNYAATIKFLGGE